MAISTGYAAMVAAEGQTSLHHELAGPSTDRAYYTLHLQHMPMPGVLRSKPVLTSS